MTVILFRFLTLHRSTPVGTIICLQDDAARLSIPHSKLLFVASILSAIDVVRICSPDRFTWQQSTRVFRALKLLHRTIKRSRHQFVQPLPTAQDAISSQRVIPDPVVFESESPSVAAGAGDRTARERMSLCQSVIQMFMSVPTRLITVDEMSRWLVKVPLPTRTHTQICSCESAIAEFTHRVRVLWDTVNVLRELELIEQISYPRKQFQWFRWVGADIYPLATKVGIDLEYEVPSWRRLRLLESISSVDLTSHAAVGSPSSSLAVQAESQTESLSSDEPPKKKSRTETE